MKRLRKIYSGNKVFIFLLIPLICLCAFPVTGQIYVNENNNEYAFCSTDIQTQIMNNALTQARRQMYVAETLISKPDSVLELSCFDQRAAFAARTLANNFSNSLDWENTTIPSNGGGLESAENPERLNSMNNISYSVSMGADHLDNIIDDMIMKGMAGYIDDNYGHSLLGGRMTVADNYASAVQDAGDVCDLIETVNYAARCNDYADESPFMQLSAFASMDTRIYPAACANTHNLTQNLLDRANDNFYIMFDRVSQTYLDYMNASNGCAASSPIPTGVRVQYKRYEDDLMGNRVLVEDVDYEDKVCVNPGCYYVPDNTCAPAP